MKKFLLSASLILSFGMFALLNQSAKDSVPVSAPVAANGPLPSSPAGKVPVTGPAPAPAPKPKPIGQYKDGVYTGIPADAYYGLVQVRATISGGRLTDVQFLSYPNERSTSRSINGVAMPYLKQEAIQAQSASVNTVSGASNTSAAFRQSLGSALSQAKA